MMALELIALAVVAVVAWVVGSVVFLALIPWFGLLLEKTGLPDLYFRYAKWVDENYGEDDRDG